jgi:putative membrane protein
MMYWNGWTWFAMTLSMVVFWTAVGVVIWVVVRRSASPTPPAPPTSSPEEVLRQRYAAGEIDETDFERRSKTLRKPMLDAGR